MPTFLRLGILAIPLTLGQTVGQWVHRIHLSRPLQTDRAEYVATPVEGGGQAGRYAFTLIARYENQTGSVLYFRHCNPRDPSPFYGVESLDSTQGSAYDEVWACVGHDYPIKLARGATRVDTLRIEGPNQWDGKTYAPLGILEGEFRLVYEVGTCERLGGGALCLLPLADRRSNPFRVRLAH